MAKRATPIAQSGIDSRRKAALVEGNAAYTARREEIIREAATVFREVGYESATLNDVATRLGTDRASLYYYVAGKDELLHEIVRDVLRRNLDAADRISAGTEPVVEKLEALIREMITSFDENYPHMYVHLEGMNRIAREDSQWADDVLEKTRRFESIVVDLLATGQRDGSLRKDVSPELTSLSLFGMINWTSRWYHPGSKHSPAEIATTFAALFLDGARQP